jgi:hypothetical protein
VQARPRVLMCTASRCQSPARSPDGLPPPPTTLPRYLKLYYLGLDAKPSVVAVCESDLRDNVNTMASYINGVKARSLTAHFQ